MDSFDFVIFADRSSDSRRSREILREAVRTASRLDPDFVMTVGNLIEGETVPRDWLEQVGSLRAIMDELPMPWYPVASGRDVSDRPRSERGHPFRAIPSHTCSGAAPDRGRSTALGWLR